MDLKLIARKKPIYIINHLSKIINFNIPLNFLPNSSSIIKKAYRLYRFYGIFLINPLKTIKTHIKIIHFDS